MLNKTIYSKRAFSMVEVVVAAIIFAAASAGVFATISYTNRKVDSDTRVQAATFAKKILDQLNGDVNALTWDATGNGLTVGSHTVAAGSDTDFPACSATYIVSSDASGARKVVITANCP